MADRTPTEDRTPATPQTPIAVQITAAFGDENAGEGPGHKFGTPEHSPDVISDPARTDRMGQDWTGEGGATPEGAATGSE